MNTKLFCVLEQGKYVNDALTLKHREQFNTPFSDFYRLNWYTNDDPNADWCVEGITLSQGKNIMYERVPKIYKYYIFIDDDMDFACISPVADRIKYLLEKYNPLHATLFRNNYNWGSWHIHYIRDLHDKHKREAWPIFGFDLDCDIYHHSYISAIFPIKYHGCYKCLGYAQYICYKLYPKKQIMMDGITLINTRQSDHSHELALPQAKAGYEITRFFIQDLKPVDDEILINNEYMIPKVNSEIYLNEIDNTEVIFDKTELTKILK